MLHKTKHATTNYKSLRPFIDAVNAAGGHKHFEAAGFMDLVIENLCFTDYNGNQVYSISHYGKQNGDLMADPDMEIAIDENTGRIIPRSFRNDYLGIHQEVFKKINGQWHYHYRLLIDLDEFLWHWMKNIDMQGFAA